jgi:DNA invertase Pin-like site-specific DNA recombinase
MITATIRVGGYPRKSNREEKAEADRKEKSVERQDAELREFVAKQPGWGIVAMYTEDGKSGALGEDGRPAFKRMMDDVRAGRLDVVVMVAPDRLARNQYEAMFAQATFVKHKVRLFYTDGGGREVDLQSSVGRFSSAAEAFGAEFTRESTTKHAVAALKRRAKAGGVVGGTIPGYTNVPGRARCGDEDDHPADRSGRRGQDHADVRALHAGPPADAHDCESHGHVEGGSEERDPALDLLGPCRVAVA